MRVLKVINNIVTETKEVLDGYVLKPNEIQSDIGELGQIKQPDGTFIDSVPPLDMVKTAKIAQIKDLYNQKLEEGFPSSVTGTSLIYDFKGDSPDLWKELFREIDKGFIPDTAFPMNITLKDGTTVPHTKVQVQQIEGDITAWKFPVYQKYQNYNSQVNACTTVDQVSAIVVTF